MTNREEFERLIKELHPMANVARWEVDDLYKSTDTQANWEGYQMRQPEIDALKAKVQEKIDNWFELLNKHDDLQRENAALKAENERLREDAERYRKLRKYRDVLLLTGFFGNGCVNRTLEEVDAELDAMKETK